MKMVGKNKLKMIIILSLIILCSCNDYNKNCRLLSERVMEEYNQGNTFIDLKTVYTFDWDILYIIKETNSREYIKKITGFDLDPVYDDEQMYLFIKDNRIIKKDKGECRTPLLLMPKFIEEGIIKIKSKNSILEILKEGSVLKGNAPDGTSISE